MRVLAVADVEEPALWDHYRAERFANIDLVVSAGDLKAEYLEFLVTMIGVPLLYVRGNHDDSYARCLPGDASAWKIRSTSTEGSVSRGWAGACVTVWGGTCIPRVRW